MSFKNLVKCGKNPKRNSWKTVIFPKNESLDRYFWRIWSHLLKKSLTKNFIFCAMLFRSNSSEFTSALSTLRLYSPIPLPGIIPSIWKKTTGTSPGVAAGNLSLLLFNIIIYSIRFNQISTFFFLFFPQE